MRLGLSVLVAAAVGFGGCGDTTTRSFNAPRDAKYTEQQVAKMAGFTTKNGLSYTGPGGCQIDVIMTTPGAIDTYAGAGDAVVTNRAGTVGVKFYPDPGCREKLLRALDRVP